MKIKFRFDKKGFWVRDYQGFVNHYWVMVGYAKHGKDESVAIVNIVFLCFSVSIGWKNKTYEN